MAKEKKIITALNYGELHMYYPLKFDTKLSFSQLCELFDKSTVVFNQEYQDKIMNSLGCSLANSTDEIKQNLSASNTDAEPFLFNVKDLSTNKTYQARDNNIPEYKIDSENIKIELFSSDSSININIVSTELEALQQRIFRMQKEFELSSQIYGNSFMSNQERFLLLPFKAKLSNGKTVWINAILFMYFL